MDSDIIFARTSVRNYTDEDVSESDVRDILAAGMAAPSAMNQQPWEFWVVRDPERRALLANSSPYAQPCGRAPLVIVTCMKTANIRMPEMAPQDMGACCENILLEATRLGLGAVWQATYPDAKRMGKVASAIRLTNSDNLVPFSLIAAGHPAHQQAATGPKHFERSRIHTEFA
ncbi:nitroreductase family protein [Atopobium sp. oral taxon 416]|uniref:nitroreductase family protein n=1 Tax=Atopobium sp. oral taxon 416 TaxID=712157 RepID=UPI001BAE240F|nr:nitroreductase family protein [Atopobium sp. oral taxon 416]QUC04499.1 nitroreductase family protein [Atopobium sp. oral taxon 416]